MTKILTKENEQMPGHKNTAEVAWFHHLHVNSRSIGDKKGTKVKIEGKERPCIVMGKCARIDPQTARPTEEKTVNGCRWYEAEVIECYLCFPLQSKEPPGRKIELPTGVVEEGRTSFVDLQPVKFTKNLRSSDQRKGYPRSVPAYVVEAIRKRATWLGLSGQLDYWCLPRQHTVETLPTGDRPKTAPVPSE